MTSQSVVVQVGQCGNQIGARFWETILHEHAAFDTNGTFSASLATFFRNTDDGRIDESLPIGSRLKHLKTRSILIDMENRVVDRVFHGPLRDIFDKSLSLVDSCGSGNNWATGHHIYGVQHSATISELLRRSAESCDNLQSFSIIHSMGGGTGSGLGTAVVRMMADEYPKTLRLVTCVFPAQHDDVITSPYNSVLALKVLMEDADCVISVDNEALSSVCSKNQSVNRFSQKHNSSLLDLRNDLVARTLADLTSSFRFDQNCNSDLNEILTDLVNFPRMKFLIPGLSPTFSSSSSSSFLDCKKIDGIFYDAFSRSNQLMKFDPKNSVFLSSLLVARGKDVSQSEIERNFEKMKKKIKFVPWNLDGWKIQLCQVPPQSHPRSVLSLANNGCFYQPIDNLKLRFCRMFRRKAHLHHFLTNGMELSDFSDSLESVSNLIFDYKQVDSFRSNGNVVPSRLLK